MRSSVEVGGGLRAYSAGGRELLDGYGADEMCTSGRGQVLLPWPNRIEDGAYEFDGRLHQLALNEPERRNAIHGLVRWSPWSVSEREPDRVVLEHLIRPAARLPVLARRRDRVRALGRRADDRDDGQERRLQPVPLRLRRPPLPDARDPGGRLGRPDGTGTSGPELGRPRHPQRPGGSRGHRVRLHSPEGDRLDPARPLLHRARARRGGRPRRASS